MRRPVLLAFPVGAAVLWDGGFSAGSRVAFGALALLVAVLAADRRRLGEPVVLVLLVLAGLAALSALWTVGSPADAVRWGLVTAGYAAIVVVAAAVRAEAIAALVCVLAFVSGAVGLAAAATHSAPFADLVHGAWRPGGTLEYPPALALLQVSALPALLTGLRHRRLRLPSSLGLVTAAAVLALAGSRTALFLAAPVLLAALARRGGTDSVRIWNGIRATPRRAAVIAAVCALATATAALATQPGGDPEAGFWHGRLHTWRAAVETAADGPLAGNGADAFLPASAAHQGEGPVMFAHDLPLELAAELGVPGALLALALYACALAAVWRARASRAGWLLGPAVVAFLAASLVDWPWHLAGSGAVWAAALGGIVGQPRGRRAGEPPGSIWSLRGRK